MRVVYFSRRYTPHDHRFLASLAATEHEVAYLQLEQGKPPLENRPLPTNIEVIKWWGGRRPLRPWDWPRAAVEAGRVLRQRDADVVHAGPIQSCAFLAALAGVNGLLTMSWGSDLLLHAQSGPGRWLARWTLARSVAFAGDCQAVAERAGALGMPPERMFLFPWGVDLKRFHPGKASALRAKLGWGVADVVLLSTRAWEPIYGLPELARAFAQFTRVEPKARLALLGAGSLGPALRRMFDEAGVGDRVRFVGQVSQQELPDYFRAADLYLSASHSDGSSISLLEAMASGLPAIVSDIPGNREWVEPGVNGWRFQVKDELALVAALQQAFGAGPNVWRELGRAGRRIAEDRADWSSNFPRLLEAYQFVRARRDASP